MLPKLATEHSSFVGVEGIEEDDVPSARISPLTGKNSQAQAVEKYHFSAVQSRNVPHKPTLITEK